MSPKIERGGSPIWPQVLELRGPMSEVSRERVHENHR
jgi:hypothetical protein